MDSKLLKQVNQTIDYLQDMRNSQKARLREIEPYLNVKLNSYRDKNGTEYFCSRDNGNGRSKYLGNASNKDVRLTKEARYLKKSISFIETDLPLLKKVQEKYVYTDYDSVNASLPKLYKNAEIKGMAPKSDRAVLWKEKNLLYKQRFPNYKHEEINISTKDGSFVRSKSEALIYNTLLDMNVTFIYELPLKVGGSFMRPDFTLLSEVDFETEIIIEHQGMMSNEYYRKRFSDKLVDYWKSGYIQGINIFFTFDSKDGGLDTTPIIDLVKSRVRR